MSKYYIPNQLNLPAIEQEIGAWWKQENMFEKSMKVHEGNVPFVFYEGPPSANGLPGIHHVISRTLKDLVCRYQTMQGKPVARKAGWDTHGLPIELGVEKELGITKDDIGKTISVEDYNKKCREAVMRFKDKWDSITDKMGYWVDLNEPYVTFKNEYIETLWWCLKELHRKGLLYKSVSIQPYSPAAGTGLSSHELNQPGTYKDVKDTSATVLFQLSDASCQLSEKKQFLEKLTKLSTINSQQSADIYILAWTTTPWTLPSNLGLTVGAKIDYVLVQTFNPYTLEKQNVILAKALVHKYFKEENLIAELPDSIADAKAGVLYKILAEFKGADLEGLEYEQLFQFESNSLEKIQEQTPNAKPFRVITGDFVTTEDGTGIVHTAPAFGADDYMVGKKNNLGILTLVDRQGKFIDGTGEYAGRYVKDYRNEKDYQDVNVDISVELKKRGQAFKVEKYEHNYPHCWRTDKPIIYYPLDAWFIRTTAVKDRMVDLNKTINWKPKATGEGRFGNWLENMVDWNLSRSRYWGTPLPVWRTEDGEEEICIGTIEELKNNLHEESELKEISDLHKPYIDKVTLKSPTGKKMYREPDLIDVWFDSGAMPYAQWGIEYAEKLKAGDKEAWQKFPADFIAEGVDQTRGWFYTLHALGVMLFDNVAYKAVVSNGLVLDKNGNKMSKRLGNVVDPFITIDKYSADATRWYLVTNASPWDSLKFDEKGIEEIQRKFFGTLYNTYSFFSLYANLDEFNFKENYIPLEKREEIDRWIISSLNTLVKNVNESYADYEPTKAGRAIQEFVDEQLSNWYVRLCRRRFWKGEYEENKIAAYQTLYECLETISKLMAPISPFFADWLFTNLNKVTGRENCESVHLTLFPTFNTKNINEKLEERMQLAQDICSLILSIRKKENVKVRQPLQKVLVPIVDTEMQNQIELVGDLIKSEVNVKEINYLKADDGFFNKKAKANFKILGAKMGTKMKEVAMIIANFNTAQIAELEKNKSIQINLAEGSETIVLEDVEIVASEVPGWSMATNGSVTVALDMTLTPNLINEGNAREIVNKIQKLRKDTGLELTDRIHVKLSEIEFIKDAVNRFNSYICAEILADSLTVEMGLISETVIDINDNNVSILLTKNNN